jgi:HD-GYP domain-containing protein (c-di-GMP phosphodiesterase class II)
MLPNINQDQQQKHNGDIKMSLEKALELNTAAVSRLADLMERFKPNAATSETSETAAPVEKPKAEKPAPKKKAPAKKVEVIEEPKAEEVKSPIHPNQRVETTEPSPKAEVIEEVKEVELKDVQTIAREIVIKGKEAKALALAALEKIAGKGTKIHSLDPSKYAEVLAALEEIKANLVEA